jgi:predicted PurR-regulated permease PerM
MVRSDRLLLEAVFLVVLVAFTAAFYRIMEPFLLALFLALVLANIFLPPFRAIQKWTGRPRVASAITIFLIFLTVAVPVSVIVTLVTAELAGATANLRNNWSDIQESLMIPALLDRLGHIPVIGPTLNRFADADISDTLREILSTSGDYLMRVSQKSLGNLSAAVLNFLIVLLLVFFFLVDGKKMVRRIYETVPVSNREIDQIVAETFSTTSATLISTIIIGILEGALATVLFVVFGLPSPFFWGVVTVVLSMIPLIGSNLIIIPAGLTVVLGGRPLAGLFIVLAGVVGVALTQNVVKPKLLGDRTGLHPALALLATLGGIAWLGLIGFLVGPVVASVFIVVWRQFARRYQRLLQDKDSAPE